MSRINVEVGQKFRMVKVAGRIYKGGEILTVNSISLDQEFYGFAEEWYNATFVNDIFGIYGGNEEILYLLEPFE